MIEWMLFLDPAREGTDVSRERMGMSWVAFQVVIEEMYKPENPTKNCKEEYTVSSARVMLVRRL